MGSQSPLCALGEFHQDAVGKKLYQCSHESNVICVSLNLVAENAHLTSTCHPFPSSIGTIESRLNRVKIAKQFDEEEFSRYFGIFQTLEESVIDSNLKGKPTRRKRMIVILKVQRNGTKVIIDQLRFNSQFESGIFVSQMALKRTAVILRVVQLNRNTTVF